MTLFEQNNAMLEHEAVYFHGCFFNEQLDQDVINKYADASRICLPVVDSQSARTIEIILVNGLDVEAIEYALRLKNRDNVLTKKLQILFFLIEVRSRYTGYFFNWKKARLNAMASIFYSIILTAYKYVKGSHLIRKYDLV